MKQPALPDRIVEELTFQILRDCWRHYQSTMKEAKGKYFSDIVILNCHKPHVLFKVINSVLNALDWTLLFW